MRERVASGSSNESMEAVTVSGDVENGKNMEEDGCFKRGQQAPYIRFNNNCLYEMEDRDGTLASLPLVVQFLMMQRVAIFAAHRCLAFGNV